MRELDKKTKLMTRIASIIVTGCILLSSIQSLAYQPSIMQPLTDTFDSVSIVQPSALNESTPQFNLLGYYPGDDCGQAVATSDGNVYIAGYANRGAGYLYDACLTKYDAELRRIWNLTWGGSGNDKAYGVAISGNYVYVTGSSTNASTGKLNMFVNKYSTNGVLVWNQNFSAGVTNVHREGYAITATADAVYIAGYQNSTHMVWKYYQNGTRDWYNSTTINSTSRAYGIAVYEGWVYEVGHSNSSGPLSQVFIRSIDDNATSDNLYIKPLGTATDERGYGIAVGAGYIYITGRSGTGYGTFNAIIEKLSTNFIVQWIRYWDNPRVTGRDECGLGITLKYDYVLFTGYSKYATGFHVGQGITAGYWTNGTSAFNNSYGEDNDEDTFRGIAAGRNCMYIAGGVSGSPYNNLNTRVYKYSTITHYPDLSYAGGSTGHLLSWTLYTRAASLTVRYYYIYHNGTLNQTEEWTPSPSGFPISVSIDGLPVGKNNVTIVAGLIDGDVVQDTTYVTVTNVQPVISMSSMAAVEFTTLGNNLSSTITDLSTEVTKYWLFQNGSLKQTDTWVHNVPIVWGVDGLAEGSYNFTIVVNDGYGLNVSGTTILTVSNWAPVITMPAAVAVNGNIGGNVLSGTITDQSIGEIQTYVVYRNGIPVQAGFWVHNLPVFWNIDGLAAGSYNFTVVATDGLGLTGRGMTIATVSAAQTCCTSGLGEAALTLAIISLGLVGTHLGWHVYRKYVPGRKSKDRP